MKNTNLEIKQTTKRRCFTAQEVDALIELYKSGATYNEMASKTGMSKTTISRTLNKMGVIEHRTTRVLSNEDVTNVVQMYLDDIPVTHIAEQYSCDVQTIYNYLRNLDIEMSRNSGRKHKFNVHYFDQIDTPNKAYILGLLFADGCNFERSVNLFLQASDKQLLQDICVEIGYNGDLEFQDHSQDRAVGIDRQDVYGVRLHSAYMCDVMSAHGVVPKKSLVLQFPTCVPDCLLSHFMRGYIDGDGHIGKTKKDNAVSFVSTLSFCEAFNRIIKAQLGIVFKIREAGNHNGITMQCDAQNTTDKKTFLDWIYQDADLKLERKYKVYLSRYCNFNGINNTLTA
jgi:intein-encoded DNA endonuclease-like protein